MPIIAALAPLKVRGFGRLLAAYVLNYLGDFAALVALAVLVYDQTESALATSGLFVAAQFVPAALAPILTARIDRGAARRVLPALYAGEALLFAALVGLASHFSLVLVYLAVLLDGVLMLSARGITRATINAILGPTGQLRAGNALLNVGFAVAGVAGTAMGGALVGAIGADVVLGVDAATFAVIALISATLPTVAQAEAEEAGMLARVRSGLAWVRSQPTVRLLIGGEALAIVFFTLIVPIEVVYAKETLETTDAGYGTFLACWSAGVVLGSVAFVGLKTLTVRGTLLLSTALMGIAYLGMAITTELAVACGFAVIGGVGNGVQWVAVMTLVQEWTPDDLQARVTGLLESAASLATGAGFLLGGVIVSLFSPPVAFAIAGGGVLALVLGGLVAGATPRRRPAAPSGGA